jgi:hypothetical protein
MRVSNQDSSDLRAVTCLGVALSGIGGPETKVDRPVYRRTAFQAVIANRPQIDESTHIPRAIAQLPWCNR